VDKNLSAIGTRLTIDVRGREAIGVVVEGPFYRKEKT